MPDFILPDEADHCVYCGKVLYDPPNCCDEAIADYEEEQQLRWNELARREQEVYD